MAPNMGFVIAGYVIAAITLGGYTWWLFARARVARRRAEAIAGRRGGRAAPERAR